MIIRTQTATKNINHQLRKELAMACRLIRRSILLSKIAPPAPDEFQIPAWKKFMVWIGIVFSSLAIWIAVGMLLSGCAQAKEIPEHKAVLAIIGEAENQGFEGMLGIAHALRNRGTLKGVYGLHAPRVHKHLYSRDTYQQATLAWEQSAVDFDITHGATYWEDVKAFGLPYWAKRMKITARIGDHVFFKN